MEKNKTGKYLKYAIGEIGLVVIGILIALSINNWNEYRNRLKLEKVLLTQLEEELLDVYGDLHSDYDLLKSGQNSHYKIIDYIENDVPYEDSMCFDFYLINLDEYIYPIDAVYERIKSEGLDIISNDTIRYLTQSIYEVIFPRMSRNNSFNPDISEYLNDYYLENFKPNKDYSLQFNHTRVGDTIGDKIYLSRNIRYPRKLTQYGGKRNRTVGYVPLNFEALKKDSKFQMLLKQTRSFRSFKLIQYNRAKYRIKILIRRIEIELKQ